MSKSAAVRAAGRRAQRNLAQKRKKERKAQLDHDKHLAYLFLKNARAGKVHTEAARRLGLKPTITFDTHPEEPVRTDFHGIPLDASFITADGEYTGAQVEGLYEAINAGADKAAMLAQFPGAKGMSDRRIAAVLDTLKSRKLIEYDKGVKRWVPIRAQQYTDTGTVAAP